MDTVAGSGTAGEVRPRLLVFDVNETLSDLSPMADRFEEVGIPGHRVGTWFAGLLRDGFALTVNGVNPGFADLAGDALRTVLREVGSDHEPEAAVAHILDGFRRLEPHPDVVPGLRALADQGLRLVTLSNGSAGVARELLQGAGVDDRFEALLSVEDAGVWKPSPVAYRYALDHCGVAAGEAMLVAVHPWDTDGAQRAGLSGCWVNRSGRRFPDSFRAPDLTVGSVEELAGSWA